MPSRGSLTSRRLGDMMEGENAQGGDIFGSKGGERDTPGEGRIYVGGWLVSVCLPTIDFYFCLTGKINPQNQIRQRQQTPWLFRFHPVCFFETAPVSCCVMRELLGRTCPG